MKGSFCCCYCFTVWDLYKNFLPSHQPVLSSTTLPYLDLKGGGPTSSLLLSYESDLPGKTAVVATWKKFHQLETPFTSVFQLPNQKCYVSPGFSRWLLIMSQRRVRCWWWNSDGWRWGGANLEHFGWVSQNCFVANTWVSVEHATWIFR